MLHSNEKGMRMSHVVLLFVLVSILFGSPTYAETPQYSDVVLHAARTSAAGGSVIPVHNANVVRLDVLITGTATVSFEVAGAGAVGWYSKLCTASDTSTPAVSTDATGVFFCTVAAANTIRANISSYTSGAVTVVARASTAF
jgi:hypothetical protein